MPRKMLLRTLAAIAIPRCSWRRTGAPSAARIDVENYVIDAEINPHTQALTANVKIRFLPLDNDISSASFELNNAFNLSRVVDEAGQQIPGFPIRTGLERAAEFPGPAAKRQAGHGDVHL